MQAIALDIGSSSIKGGILDLERRAVGDVVAEAFPEPVGGLPALHFEVDPLEIVRRARRVVDELLRRAPDARALLTCTQMGGLLLLGADGEPRSRYLSWRDQRAVATEANGAPTFVQDLRVRLGPDVVRRLGNEIQPGNALTLAAWLARHGQLPDGVTAVNIGNFVLTRLCRADPLCHPTAAQGLLDVAARTWCTEAMSRLGLERVRWPRLAHDAEPLGEFRHAAGVLRVFPAAGDHQSALLGAGLRERELSVNVSTGSQVSLLTREPLLGDYQTRAYFGGAYLNTVTHLPAGRSLNVLFDLLTSLTPPASRDAAAAWEQIRREVEACGPAGDGPHVDLAFYAGPMGDRGSIADIRAGNLTIGRLFRAAFENMADNYATAARRFGATPSWDALVMSGGLVGRFPVLRDLIAARFPQPHRLVSHAEETLQGLTAMASDMAGRGVL